MTTRKVAELNNKGDSNANRLSLVVTISDWVDMVPVSRKLCLDGRIKLKCSNRSSNKAVDKISCTMNTGIQMKGGWKRQV
jgi:hypothetical protein